MVEASQKLSGHFFLVTHCIFLSDKQHVEWKGEGEDKENGEVDKPQEDDYDIEKHVDGNSKPRHSFQQKDEVEEGHEQDEGPNLPLPRGRTPAVVDKPKHKDNCQEVHHNSIHQFDEIRDVPSFTH